MLMCADAHSPRIAADLVEGAQLPHALPAQVHEALGLSKYDLLACKEPCPDKCFGFAFVKLDPLL